ncbi:MAG: hypothetical protein ACR2RL_13390 [Gammaproteobacteria bacterium]
MTFKEIDWRILRGPMALLLICAAFGGGLVMLSHTFVTKAKAELRTHSAQFRSIRNQYHGVDEEGGIIDEYQPIYEQLVARGVVGSEYRLDWVEALRASAQALKLPSLRYTLDTQMPFEAGPKPPGTKSMAYSSVMTLEVGLLHEEDLFSLFDELDRRAPGLFSVSSCTLSLDEGAIHAEASLANLNAECKLDWFTVKMPEDEATQPARG